MRMRISPCLWFDNQAEEAARFYTAIFPLVPKLRLGTHLPGETPFRGDIPEDIPEGCPDISRR